MKPSQRYEKSEKAESKKSFRKGLPVVLSQTLCVNGLGLTPKPSQVLIRY